MQTSRRGSFAVINLNRHALAAGIAIIVICTSPAIGQPCFIPLTPPNPANTGAYAISADGRVVVGYFGSKMGRWTAETGWQSFTTVNDGGAGLSGGPFAVSADGSVIVGRQLDIAFRWSADTDLVSLGDLPGGATNSGAFSVSADGNVIVGYGIVFDDGARAARWVFDPKSGTFTGPEDLGDLPNGETCSYAFAVSADGTTVVGRGSAPPGLSSGLQAVQWIGSWPATPVVIANCYPVGQHGFCGASSARATTADGSAIFGLNSFSNDPPYTKLFRILDGVETDLALS
ncbi:MAG: hypothetical protein L0Y44_00370 [Phycisphaerales bacterium]|nr:hypothetical protein [Phycisphaerales bacterium]MCI0674392.1 hypothetical protein [Phycisphaerales bacterium]